MESIADGEIVKLDVSQLAKMLSVSRSSLYKWLSGKFEPGLSKLAALAEITNVSLDWLIAGRGEIRPQALPGYYQFNFDAGPGPLAFERKWLDRTLGGVEGTQAPPLLVEVRDDSMEPTFRKGDVLLGFRTRSANEENGIYLCTHIGGSAGGDENPAARVFPRRIEWKGTGKAVVKCDNPAYPLILEVSPENDRGISIVGRVVWFGRTL